MHACMHAYLFNKMMKIAVCRLHAQFCFKKTFLWTERTESHLTPIDLFHVSCDHSVNLPHVIATPYKLIHDPPCYRFYT